MYGIKSHWHIPRDHVQLAQRRRQAWAPSVTRASLLALAMLTRFQKWPCCPVHTVLWQGLEMCFVCPRSQDPASKFLSPWNTLFHHWSVWSWRPCCNSPLVSWPHGEARARRPGRAVSFRPDGWGHHPWSCNMLSTRCDLGAPWHQFSLFAARQTGVKSQLCHFFIEWPWQDFIFLSEIYDTCI